MACIRFTREFEGLGISRESLFIIVYIPYIFLLNFCNFYVLHICACTCVCLCVCLCGCAVVCECGLNVSLRSLKTMRAHSFVNYIFLAIREKDSLYILPLESITSI